MLGLPGEAVPSDCPNLCLGMTEECMEDKVWPAKKQLDDFVASGALCPGTGGHLNVSTLYT